MNKNNNIGSLSLAFTYAGCYIGAGFLSGNELWQFFGSFGKFGFVGLIIAIIIQGYIAYVCLDMAGANDISEFDKLIVKKDNKLLRSFFSITEMIFIFFIITVMIAGFGSLLNTVFNIPKIIGSLIFSIIVAIISLTGIQGVVKIFSSIIPILTLATLIIGVIALVKFGYPNVSQSQNTGKTWMLPNFFISGIVFAIHNLYCSLGVITPIGYIIKSKNVRIQGVIIASGILILISIAVLLPLYSLPSFAGLDLPMLSIAKEINVPLSYAYSLFLAMAIFGVSVSNLVAVVDFTSKKSKTIEKNKIIATIIIVLVAFAISLVGFTKLIAILYPLSGYVGLIALVFIFYNYFKKEN